MAVFPTAPRSSLAPAAQLPPIEAGSPECQKYWLGQASVSTWWAYSAHLIGIGLHNVSAKL